MKPLSRTILLTVVASLALFGQGNGGQHGNDDGQHGNNDQHQGESPDVPSTTPNGWIDVIVQFKTTPNKKLLKQLGIWGYDGGGQNGHNDDNYGDDNYHFGKNKAGRV